MSKGFKTRMGIEIHDIDREAAMSMLTAMDYVPLQTGKNRAYGAVGYHWWDCSDSCPNGPDLERCAFCDDDRVTHLVVPSGDWLNVFVGLAHGGPTCVVEWSCFNSELGACYVAALEQWSSLIRCSNGELNEIEYSEVWHLV